MITGRSERTFGKWKNHIEYRLRGTPDSDVKRGSSSLTSNGKGSRLVSPRRTSSGQVRANRKIDPEIRFNDGKNEAELRRLIGESGANAPLDLENGQHKEIETRLKSLREEISNFHHVGGRQPQRQSRISPVDRERKIEQERVDDTRTIGNRKNQSSFALASQLGELPHQVGQQSAAKGDHDDNSQPNVGGKRLTPDRKIDAQARRVRTLGINQFGQHFIKDSYSSQIKFPSKTDDGDDPWGNGYRAPRMDDEGSITAFPEEYDEPWGKGYGAPRRDNEGNVLAYRTGSLEQRDDDEDITMRRRAQAQYLKDLEHGMEEHKRIDSEMKEYIRTPFGDLVTCMRKGQVGKPRRNPATGLLDDHHLPSSDVTQFLGATRPLSCEPTEDLTEAAEQRNRLKQLDKLRSQQEAQRHYDTFSGYFGKPGYGAPRHYLEDSLKNRRLNLNEELENNILYSKGDLAHQKKQFNWADLKVLSNPDAPPMVAQRSTVDSNHKNLFDGQMNGVDGSGVNYKLSTPWALD